MTTTEHPLAPVPTASASRWRARLRTGAIPYSLSVPVIVWFAVFLLVPVIEAVTTSLGQNSTGASGFGNYTQILSTGFYRSVLYSTLITGVLSTVLTLVIGYPIAVYLAFSADQARRYVSLLVLSPLLISVVVKGYSLAILLGPASPLNRLLPGSVQINLLYSQPAMIIGFVYTFLPFMVLSLNASMAAVDPRIMTAARSLGAGYWRVLKDVIFPLSLPGVVSGCVLVCTLSMSSVALPILLGGNGYQMWNWIVYNAILVTSDWPTGFAMGILLCLVILVLIALGWLIMTLARRREAR